MVTRKNCPICGVQNTGGWPHRWHKEAHRKKGYSVDDLTKMADENRELRHTIAIVCHAVDVARQPDGWRSNPKKSRTEYHREYYWRHADKRRRQRRENKTMRRRVRPLIAGLCRAVDLGRISARW
jgi:hypothetical protein